MPMGYAQMHGNSKGSEATPGVHHVLNKREKRQRKKWGEERREQTDDRVKPKYLNYTKYKKTRYFNYDQ